MSLTSKEKEEIEDRAAKAYFRDSMDYEELCNQIFDSLCKKCPHQHDEHSANCNECCPVERAYGKWNGEGVTKVPETFHSEDGSVDYFLVPEKPETENKIELE